MLGESEDGAHRQPGAQQQNGTDDMDTELSPPG